MQSSEFKRVQENDLKQKAVKCNAMSRKLILWLQKNRAIGKIHIWFTQKRAKIMIQENEKDAAENENMEQNIEQQLGEQIQLKKDIKKNQKNIKAAAKERASKNDNKTNSDTGQKGYSKQNNADSSDNKNSLKDIWMTQKQKQQMELEEKVKKEMEDLEMLASVVTMFQKPASPPPTYSIFSRLDKNIIKALLIKCTEIEDDELGDLRNKFL